jgi:hypothetical protein
MLGPGSPPCSVTTPSPCRRYPGRLPSPADPHGSAWRTARTSAGAPTTSRSPAATAAVARLLFAIDACESRDPRLACQPLPGISGGMVCDLMVACVERRFDATRTDHTVELLSDPSSANRAKGTLYSDLPWPAARLNPARSLESIGHREGVRENPQAQFRPSWGSSLPGSRTRTWPLRQERQRPLRRVAPPYVGASRRPTPHFRSGRLVFRAERTRIPVHSPNQQTKGRDPRLPAGKMQCKDLAAHRAKYPLVSESGCPVPESLDCREHSAAG